MRWDDKQLAVGSGFIASLEGANFLVTARHNLSGRHWESNELMSEWNVDPNNVTIRMQANNPGVLEWKNLHLPLVGDDGFPLWFEHPTLGRQVDVAVLPLSDDPEYFVESFDIAVPPPSREPLLSAGDELSVVGYPRGFSPYIGVPIWVRASVASEPSIGYKALPTYLVDSRTTTGQSGSAVVLRPGVNRAVQMRDQSIVATAIDDAWIAGVYSGRISLPDVSTDAAATSANPEGVSQRHNNDLDIGIVWTTGAILATIQGRTRISVSGEEQRRWEPGVDWSETFDTDSSDHEVPIR
jgi:hypothetical protein